MSQNSEYSAGGSELPAFQSTVQHWEWAIGGTIGIGRTAQDMMNAAIVYFKRCDDNPIYKNEAIRSGKRTGEIIQIPVNRPYTLHGLCLHLGITREYILDVAKSREQNDFYFVAKTILEIIYTQQLEGVLTGLYNPIAGGKLLGLNSLTPNDKPTPNVTINVITTENQKLLTNEHEIEIPKDKI